jgi:hypothetical protein
MTMRSSTNLMLTIGLSTALLACSAQEQATAEADDEPSPAVEEMAANDSGGTIPATPALETNPLRDAYFGNFHVHTSYSFDGYTNGSVTTPDDAYRWAKGESIPGGGGGGELQIKKPLDWYVVSDHAEYLGVFRKMEDPESPFSKLPIAARLTSDDQVVAFEAFGEVLTKMSEGESDPALSDPEISRTIWSEVVGIADSHSAPGRFTTFPCFEWTSNPGKQNLHRVVFFESSQNSPTCPSPRSTPIAPRTSGSGWVRSARAARSSWPSPTTATPATA